MDAWRIRRKNYHRPWNELRIGRLLFFRCGTRDKSSEWDSIVVLQLLVVWPKPRAIQPTVWSNSEFCYIMLYIMFWWLSHVKSVIKPHISVNDMYPNDPKKQTQLHSFYSPLLSAHGFSLSSLKNSPFFNSGLGGMKPSESELSEPPKDRHAWQILVGGFNHLETIWKSMRRIIPYIMANKKCLKPPTRIC